MIRAARALLGVAALALAVPGAAQQDTAAFSIGSVRFSLAAPDGFCLPESETMRVLGQFNDADPYNITPAALVSCGANPFESYVLIKSPKISVNTAYNDKGAVLAQWEAEMQTMDTPAGKAEVNDITEKAINDRFGTDVEMETGATFLGRDADCVYIGGVSKIANGSASALVQNVACLTVRGKRGLSINVYRIAPEVDLELLKSRALATALAIEPVQ